jgi:hypothetical protein
VPLGQGGGANLFGSRRKRKPRRKLEKAGENWLEAEEN